jgi:hypothetical protein
MIFSNAYSLERDEFGWLLQPDLATKMESASICIVMIVLEEELK